MILFILAAFLIAKINKYKIAPVFKVIDLYPLFFVELVYWILQVVVIFENYQFLKYAIIVQKSFLIVMFLPILRRALYKPALFAAGTLFLGSLLNIIVMNANGGKMPVYPTLSYLTGYYKNDALLKGADNLHILMTNSTKLNFLADYIDVGFSIYSIGDVINHLFLVILVFYTIKKINKVV